MVDGWMDGRFGGDRIFERTLDLEASSVWTGKKLVEMGVRMTMKIVIE